MGILCKIEITRPRQPELHAVGEIKTAARADERKQIIKTQEDIIRRHETLSDALIESLERHAGSDEEFSEKIAEIVYGKRRHLKEMLVQKQQARYDRYLNAINSQLSFGKRSLRKAAGRAYEWWYARQIPEKTAEIRELVREKGRVEAIKHVRKRLEAERNMHEIELEELRTAFGRKIRT